MADISSVTDFINTRNIFPKFAKKAEDLLSKKMSLNDIIKTANVSKKLITDF